MEIKCTKYLINVNTVIQKQAILEMSSLAFFAASHAYYSEHVVSEI